MSLHITPVLFCRQIFSRPRTFDFQMCRPIVKKNSINIQSHRVRVVGVGLFFIRSIEITNVIVIYSRKSFIILCDCSLSCMLQIRVRFKIKIKIPLDFQDALFDIFRTVRDKRKHQAGRVNERKTY